MRLTQNVMMTTQTLRAIRLEKGLTLQQVAKAAGMHVGNLSRVELGKEFPRSKRVERLAKALNLPLTQVYAALTAKNANSSDERRQDCVERTLLSDEAQPTEGQRHAA